MHEPENGAFSKTDSPVKWRRAFAEAINDKRRADEQTNSWLVTTAVLVAVATVLFVFVALP